MIFVLRDKAITENLINQLNKIAYGDGRFVYQVEIKEYKAKRSLSQNRLYWKWLGEISKQYYETHGKLHSAETWSEYFKTQFLDNEITEIHGEVLKVRKTTTKLNTKQFTEYLEQIDFYCGSELHIQLPHPGDYIYAMGIK